MGCEDVPFARSIAALNRLQFVPASTPVETITEK